jgi:NitT/TauT family transport system ATP-binding protein
MAAAKIAFEGVGKIFAARGREVPALRPTDLAVAPEEFVALVGPSGCGKSTMLNIAAGLIAPSTGRVLYDGTPIAGVNTRVGYMTQKDTLLPWRNVVDNIGVALELRSHAASGRERAERIKQMVALVGLAGFENHYPGELSGGMRKRVALARSLIYEPETLLMDEPFGALDAQLKLVMQDELLRLTRARRMTVLFVTHDLGEAIALSDRVVVFSVRPGAVKAIRDVTLPRERDVFRARFTDEFGRLHEDLWNELSGEIFRGAHD